MNKKTGLLLINLGTPTAPSLGAVIRYLWIFLTDPRVIRLPFGVRHALVSLIILLRARRSTHAYQSIWTKQGSPLAVHSHALYQSLQEALGGEIPVALGMRYGKPSIHDALSDLKTCDHLLVMPLYPQYAESSTGTALEVVFKTLSRWRVIPSLEIRSEFYHRPLFIKAWVSQIQKHKPSNAFLLLSYHGLPARVATLGAYSYVAQCKETSDLIAQKLGILEGCYQTSFQSRVGREAWVQPYTEEILMDLYQKGERHLCVACPSFVTDCLETLEEIGLQLKEQWLSLGGETFTLVPCLNAEKETIEFLKGELKR